MDRRYENSILPVDEKGNFVLVDVMYLGKIRRSHGVYKPMERKITEEPIEDITIEEEEKFEEVMLEGDIPGKKFLDTSIGISEDTIVIEREDLKKATIKYLDINGNVVGEDSGNVIDMSTVKGDAAFAEVGVVSKESKRYTFTVVLVGKNKGEFYSDLSEAMGRVEYEKVEYGVKPVNESDILLTTNYTGDRENLNLRLKNTLRDSKIKVNSSRGISMYSLAGDYVVASAGSGETENVSVGIVDKEVNVVLSGKRDQNVVFSGNYNGNLVDTTKLYNYFSISGNYQSNKMCKINMSVEWAMSSVVVDLGSEKSTHNFNVTTGYTHWLCSSSKTTAWNIAITFPMKKGVVNISLPNTVEMFGSKPVGEYLLMRGRWNCMTGEVEILERNLI